MQKELAIKSGVAVRTIRDIETGRIVRPRPSPYKRSRTPSLRRALIANASMTPRCSPRPTDGVIMAELARVACSVQAPVVMGVGRCKEQA